MKRSGIYIRAWMMSTTRGEVYKEASGAIMRSYNKVREVGFMDRPWTDNVVRVVGTEVMERARESSHEIQC